jgi:hypothetical protein
MSNALVHNSKHLYTFLLKLYPKNYRLEFEEEMEFVFSEQLKDTLKENGALGIVNLWRRTIIDATKSSITEHLENKKGDDSMKSKQNDMIMNNSIFGWIALATTSLLLVPWLANWPWDPSDFIIMGTLISGTGSIFVLIARHVRTTKQRVILGLVCLFALLWLWVELAVGLFTNWGS